jgi:hypothetical protein
MAFDSVQPGAVERGVFDRFRGSISPEWVESALQATGTATVRKRRLPAEQVLWLVLGMALFRDLSIADVARELELALPVKGKRGVVPSALSQGRQRLGPDPLRWLFERCAQAWAVSSAASYAWRGLAVYGLDGTTVRIPDSLENRATFGDQGAGAGRGNSGYPLVRLVTLMALRSHLLLAARFGAYRTDERAYAKELWPLLPEGSLCIVDRNFLAAGVLIPLAAKPGNRHWLTRARKTTHWKKLKTLGRGDELVEIEVSDKARTKDRELPRTWIVRAIRYRRRGFSEQTLLTSLLDVKRYPAKEVIELYHERWELELGFDEVKTEMLEREESIRSKRPPGVVQELWGLLLAYNLVRLEMQEVARDAKLPPTRVSFVAGLRFIRTTLLSMVFTSPGAIPRRLQNLRADLQHFILPPRRRARSYPREVKIKMSGYARKRTEATHRSPN